MRRHNEKQVAHILSLIVTAVRSSPAVELDFGCFGYIYTTWQRWSNLKCLLKWKLHIFRCISDLVHFWTSNSKGILRALFFSTFKCVSAALNIIWRQPELLFCLVSIHYRWWFGSGSWADCACCLVTWSFTYASVTLVCTHMQVVSSTQEIRHESLFKNSHMVNRIWMRDRELWCHRRATMRKRTWAEVLAG